MYHFSADFQITRLPLQKVELGSLAGKLCENPSSGAGIHITFLLLLYCIEGERHLKTLFSQMLHIFVKAYLAGLISKAVKTYFDRKAVKTSQNWFKPVKTWSKPETQEHVPRAVKEPCYLRLLHGFIFAPLCMAYGCIWNAENLIQ